jgi:hypothetical protein
MRHKDQRTFLPPVRGQWSAEGAGCLNPGERAPAPSTKTLSEPHIWSWSCQWWPYELDYQGGSNTDRGRRFLFSKTSRPNMGPTLPLIAWILAFFPGRKAAGRKLPHSSKNKNQRSHTSTPHMCLHDQDRDSVTFTIWVSNELHTSSFR